MEALSERLIIMLPRIREGKLWRFVYANNPEMRHVVESTGILFETERHGFFTLSLNVEPWPD
jgi:hypothetical protein